MLQVFADPGLIDDLRRRQVRLDTKWSRYEIRSLAAVQSCQIKLHSQKSVHRLAMKAFFEPEQPIIQLMTPSSDDELLKGGVPQPCDWVRAWRSIETTSFRAFEKHTRVENFVAPSRATPTSRKAGRAMVRIMGYAVRRRKKETLMRAFCISLSADDKGPKRVIRYLCDPTDVEQFSFADHMCKKAGLPGHYGVLATLHRLDEASELVTYQPRLGGNQNSIRQATRQKKGDQDGAGEDRTGPEALASGLRPGLLS